MAAVAISAAITGWATILLIAIDAAIDALWWRKWQRKHLPQPPR